MTRWLTGLAALVAFGVLGWFAWSEPAGNGGTRPQAQDAGAQPPSPIDAGFDGGAEEADAAPALPDAGVDAGSRETPAVARTFLTVNAIPWAEVTLDGRPIGRTVIRRRPIRVGRHTIVLVNPPTNAGVRHTFEARANEPITIIAEMQSGTVTVRAQ